MKTCIRLDRTLRTAEIRPARSSSESSAAVAALGAAPTLLSVAQLGVPWKQTCQ